MPHIRNARIAGGYAEADEAGILLRADGGNTTVMDRLCPEIFVRGYSRLPSGGYAALSFRARNVKVASEPCHQAAGLRFDFYSMYANSSPIVSNQTAVNDQLAKLVARHAVTRFLKPIAPYSEAAFDVSIAAWRAAGEPPLILDAGCGTGVSTRHLAAQFPGHFVIGVDQSADRLGRAAALPCASPSNFITVRADLVDYWRLMQQAEIYPDRHFLLYPNPWPKKHHVGRRWHGHPVFPTIVALGGRVECRSNWRIYIEECAAALHQLTGIDVGTEAYLPSGTSALHDHAGTAAASCPITPFEAKYLASGHSLWRCRVHIAHA